MSGNDPQTILQETRAETLAALLTGLDRRGVLFDLMDGVFRYCDESGALSEAEETGMDVCRAGLTEALRERRGLCLSCKGTPAKATLPRYPTVPRITPAYCRACWNKGAWKGPI